MLGDELVVEKAKSAMATVAVARRRPRGRLALVGLGPGARDLLTPRAKDELRRASVWVGLDQYVDQVRDLARPGTRLVETGLGKEEERAHSAVLEAQAGHAVALIGSGDAGVYAMASPALEFAGDDIDVVGVPGVTAALAASSLLGAPLGHDHASVSLSDLHTPWPAIEQRIRAVAEADLVVTFYNPRSRGRDWQLPKAVSMLLEHRPASTPVGVVTDASRPTETRAADDPRRARPGDGDDVRVRRRRLLAEHRRRRSHGDAARVPVGRSVSSYAFTDDCTACGACLLTCPEHAIVVGLPLPVREDRCTVLRRVRRGVPGRRRAGAGVRPGTVALVGAGPGDPGLLTLRAAELLREADVVLVDRLVHPDVLAHCRPDCELVDVGKTSWTGTAPRQDEISASLVAHAQAGRRVVRLKGGDPFVFGRGCEEAEALVEAGVPFEVVPGISCGARRARVRRDPGDRPRRDAGRLRRDRAPGPGGPGQPGALAGAGAGPGHARRADGPRPAAAHLRRARQARPRPRAPRPRASSRARTPTSASSSAPWRSWPRTSPRPA